MKKVYINPTIEIVKVTTCNMIATSIQDAVTETTLDPNAPSIDNPSGMESRGGRGFWDDEDEY